MDLSLSVQLDVEYKVQVSLKRVSSTTVSMMKVMMSNRTKAAIILNIVLVDSLACVFDNEFAYICEFCCAIAGVSATLTSYNGIKYIYYKSNYTFQ